MRITRRALAIGLVVAGVGGLAASPAVAKVQITVKTGSPESVQAAPIEDVYRVGGSLSAFCGKGQVPLAAGWRGPATFVPDAAPRFDRDNNWMQLRPRGSVTRGRLRPLAVCARGLGRVAVKSSSREVVSCGSRTAIGIPQTARGPFQDSSVTASPVSRTRWRSTLESARATALCVGRDKLKRVQTVKRTKTWVVGRTSLTVKATCRAPRRPVAWGYTLPDMPQNVYRQAGITNERVVPFVSGSQPNGRRGWKLTFHTADGQIAKAPAPVTAYVTCAVPN